MAHAEVNPTSEIPPITFDTLEILALRTEKDALLILTNRTGALRIRCSLEEANYIAMRLRPAPNLINAGRTDR